MYRKSAQLGTLSLLGIFRKFLHLAICAYFNFLETVLLSKKYIVIFQMVAYPSWVPLQ